MNAKDLDKLYNLLDNVLKDFNSKKEEIIIASRRDKVIIIIDKKCSVDELKDILKEIKKYFPYKDFNISLTLNYTKNFKLDEKKGLTYIEFFA